MSRRPSTNSRSGPSAFSLARVTISRPFCQVVITVNAMMPMSSGSQAPCTSLVRFAAKNIRSTSKQHAAADQHQPQRPSPPGAGVVEEQRGGDGDRSRHRHAERVRQRGRAAECEDEDQHRHHQQPVDPRDVDLADRRRRGVCDPQPRQVAELSRLRRHRERPGDHRLRRDDRRRGGEQHHRNPRPLRGEQEERRAHRRLRRQAPAHPDRNSSACRPAARARASRT